jgi:hypothetical protein
MMRYNKFTNGLLITFAVLGGFFLAFNIYSLWWWILH